MGGVLRLGNQPGACCGRRVRSSRKRSPKAGVLRSVHGSRGAVVVALSTVGGVDCVEWWVGSSGSRDEWPWAMSSKSGG